MTIELIRCAEDTREALHTAGLRAARGAVLRTCNLPHRSEAGSLVSIKKDTLGKPYAHLHGRVKPVSVSISHTFPFAFAAATEIDDLLLGVDIERIRIFSRAMREAFLTPAEQAHIANAVESEQPFLDTLSWSLKEAFLKAIGIGLRERPSLVDISDILTSGPGFARRVMLRDVPHTVEARWRRIGTRFVATTVALSPCSAYDGTIRNQSVWTSLT